MALEPASELRDAAASVYYLCGDAQITERCGNSWLVSRRSFDASQETWILPPVTHLSQAVQRRT